MTADKQKLAALACGIVSALMIGLFLASIAYANNRRNDALIDRYGGDSVEVCVARRNLKAGQRIEQDDIAYKKWPVALLVGHPILKRNTLAMRDRRLNRAVLQGEPFSLEQLRSARNRIDTIPEGYTAVTLETDSARALGGEITAGMIVAVMTTQEPLKSQVLVQKAEVLSSNTQSAQAKDESLIGGSSKGEIAWVTLAIPDKKVEAVVAASVADATYIVLPKDAHPIFESKETSLTGAGETVLNPEKTSGALR